MKKIILGLVLTLIGFNSFADKPVTINQEDVCFDFSNGKKIKIAKIWIGKTITFTGEMGVKYIEATPYASSFVYIDNGIKSKDSDLISTINFIKNVTEKTKDKYLNLDGKNLTLIGKIRNISSKYDVFSGQCNVYADLISYTEN